MVTEEFFAGFTAKTSIQRTNDSIPDRDFGLTSDIGYDSRQVELFYYLDSFPKSGLVLNLRDQELFNTAKDTHHGVK
jgi:hypothetical protein